MAHHTTEGTGVLRLTAVTPVIQALFGGYDLDGEHPGAGQAYIRKSTDEGYPTWEGVAGKLTDLAEAEGLALGGDASLKDLVTALASHYGKDASAVQHLPEPEWEDDAGLDDLFEIARILDDGHGLVSLELKSAFHARSSEISEFGGHGLFIGRGVVAHSRSHTAVGVGQKLNEAVLAKDIDASVAILREQLAGTLNWITDPTVKLEVAKRLGLPG